MITSGYSIILLNLDVVFKRQLSQSWIIVLFSDLMSGGVSRLKMLAQGLGDKIESQNEQLDRINAGVSRADIKLTDQNRQMRKILK